VIGVAFTGCGSAVPQRRVTNAEVAARFGISEEWITSRTGVLERRYAASGQGTSSLAVAAGREALEHAGYGPDDIGLLLVATATPDQPCPATSAFVQHGLDLPCGAADINAECSGFVYALALAATYASALRQRVLVIGADVHSPYIDPKDRDTVVLLGDGAAAFIVEPSDSGGVLAFDLGCDGSGASLLCVPAGGTVLPATGETVAAGLHYLRMDGRELFRRAVRAMVDTTETTLERAGIRPDEVDWLVPHQANARIIGAAVERLRIPAERVLTNLDRYANTSSASIPLALVGPVRTGRVRDGDRVLLVGFGAGMTWASALVEWTTQSALARPASAVPVEVGCI